MSPISLVSLWGLPKTNGARVSIPASSASKLTMELLQWDRIECGDGALESDRVGLRARYADNKAFESGLLLVDGNIGRLILL